MKKLATVLAVAIIAVVASAEKAQAIPAFAKAFTERYVNTSKNADFVAAAKEKKCNLCHFVQAKRTRMTSAKHLRSISRRQITVQHEYVKKLMPSKKNLTKDLKRFWLKRIRPEKLISH